MSKSLAALCLVALPLAAMAEAPSPSLQDFLVAEACAIGPKTKARALAAGVDAAEFDAYAAALPEMAGVERSGDWLIIPSEACKILPPKIESDLSFEDPEIASLIANSSEKYPPPLHGDPGGCYFDEDVNVALLQVVRQWSKEQAERELNKLLAVGLLSGEVAFYGEDEDELPLPSPLRYLGSSCPHIVDIDRIARSHQFMIDNFDEIIRNAGAQGDCSDSSALWAGMQSQMESYRKRGMRNVWLPLELTVIVIAAGWQEEFGYFKDGYPRPPLCRYSTDAILGE